MAQPSLLVPLLMPLLVPLGDGGVERCAPCALRQLHHNYTIPAKKPGAAAHLGLIRALPQMPWPLVHPLDSAVPAPTARPAAMRRGRGSASSTVGGSKAAG